MKTVWAFLGCLVVTASAHSENLSFQCPASYPMKETRIPEVPDGWDGIGMVSAGLTLKTAGAVDGSSSGLRTELHGSYKKTGGGWESTFEFAESEKWVYCGYGSGIELLRRLPARISRCDVTSKTGKTSDAPHITISCR